MLFFVNIYSHTILKIPIELQLYIKVLVLILMHRNEVGTVIFRYVFGYYNTI